MIGFMHRRPVVVECDVFPQANGSARVSVPPLGTDVLAAVKVRMSVHHKLCNTQVCWVHCSNWWLTWHHIRASPFVGSSCCLPQADIVEVDPTRPNQGSIEASADLGAGAAAALSQRDGKAAIAELTAKLQQ